MEIRNSDGWGGGGCSVLNTLNISLRKDVQADLYVTFTIITIIDDKRSLDNQIIFSHRMVCPFRAVYRANIYFTIQIGTSTRMCNFFKIRSRVLFYLGPCQLCTVMQYKCSCTLLYITRKQFYNPKLGFCNFLYCINHTVRKFN